jgi:endonuclease-3 related protein
MNYHRYNSKLKNEKKLKNHIGSLKKIQIIYNKLLRAYGNQNWWPSETTYEMMIGAILTQNTSWTNVEKAISNFQGDLSPERILNIENENLSAIIRPSGFHNQKAQKLKNLTNWYKKYNFNIKEAQNKDGESLRSELLDIKGIGKETADCILTYALEKPYFVVDTYTRRLFTRIGIDVPKDYDRFRLLIEDWIEKDLYVYNEYHALIVEHGKRHCKKKAVCEGCPLIKLCEFGKLKEVSH